MMSRQPGLEKVVRNAALLGAACWAVDKAQRNSNIAIRVSSDISSGKHVAASEANQRPPGQPAQLGMPNTVSLPSLLSFFGAVPAVTLQRGVCNGFSSNSLLSGWQPSCYVAPEASYQAGMSPPASALKGDATAARRAATVASDHRVCRCELLEWHVEHPEIAQAIRGVLEERGIWLPDCHFRSADVELVRYAITVGLLTARTPDERRKVVEAAAQRAQATAEWLESHEFLPEAELSSWEDVVHWAKDDPEGRPVLIVHLKAALKQDAAGAKRAAEAILTHMECALQQRLRDDLGGPEQVVVVLDSRGAPTLQFRKLVTAIQNIALTLNRHYPARLYRLYLVDAPAIVHLPVRAIKAMLHPSTSSKILICELGDERLPLDLNQDAALHEHSQH